MESLKYHPSAALVTSFFSFLFFLFYLLLKRTSASRKVNKSEKAPEAGGAWPIIGHLPMLGSDLLPHFALGAMADKYGPAFTIRLGVRRALVVSSSEVAKECFVTKDRVFATRPTSVALKIMGYNNAIFGFAPYGPYWREIRKIATLELLSNHRLELLKHVRASEVNTWIKELYQVWAKNKNRGKGSVVVDMKQWFGELTLNVTVRMVCGKRYFGGSAACNGEEARRCQKAMRDLFYFTGLFMVSDYLPWLGWLDMQGHERAMKRTAKDLDGLFERWLQEHRQNIT